MYLQLILTVVALANILNKESVLTQKPQIHEEASSPPSLKILASQIVTLRSCEKMPLHMTNIQNQTSSKLKKISEKTAKAQNHIYFLKSCQENKAGQQSLKIQMSNLDI